MTYLGDLQDAHKARRARLWPAPPQPDHKSFELLVAEKDQTIGKQAGIIESLQAEIGVLKTKVESLQWAAKAGTQSEQQQTTQSALLPVTVANIVAATCKHFSISYADMIGHRRTLEVIMPRQIAMYLAKKLTHRSLPEIGRRIGGRDHTTVLHAYRKIQDMVDNASPIIGDIAIISAMLVTSDNAHDKTRAEHVGTS